MRRKYENQGLVFFEYSLPIFIHSINWVKIYWLGLRKLRAIQQVLLLITVFIPKEPPLSLQSNYLLKLRSFKPTLYSINNSNWSLCQNCKIKPAQFISRDLALKGYLSRQRPNFSSTLRAGGLDFSPMIYKVQYLRNQRSVNINPCCRLYLPTWPRRRGFGENVSDTKDMKMQIVVLWAVGMEASDFVW